MAKYTYTITNCNGMSGGVWARAYETRNAARDAIAEAYGWAEAVLSPPWEQTTDGSDTLLCWSAYSTQEECDADQIGAHAPWIARRSREPTDLVTIEEMPDQHRSSHRAAGNWGVYPINGATRREVSRDEADEIIESDPDGYAHIVD